MAPSSARARLLDRAGWAIFGAILTVAALRAASARPPAPAKEASETQQRTAFVEITSEEAAQRAKGAETFPVDAWSQDDAFHHSEWESVESIAKREKVRFADILRAIDDGVRERWPRAAGVNVQATVPPCRPRAIY